MVSSWVGGRAAIASYLEEEYMMHMYLGLMDTPVASLMHGLTRAPSALDCRPLSPAP